jgi:hypothetical protein
MKVERPAFPAFVRSAQAAPKEFVILWILWILTFGKAGEENGFGHV